VSVVVEYPRPIQLTPLIVAAYQLTPREREVAELVLQGLLTKQIARLLQITEYTVQDHLKSIFAKTGTATRGELCLELFTRFYHPRYEQGISPGPYGFFLGE
jgi:DNA-binding CsgD family transcriptional regulator